MLTSNISKFIKFSMLYKKKYIYILYYFFTNIFLQTFFTYKYKREIREQTLKIKICIYIDFFIY